MATSELVSQDTRLLDVLAQEFDTQGKSKRETDVNGFAVISGLNSITSKSGSNRYSKPNREDRKGEFRSSLSSIKTIQM